MGGTERVLPVKVEREPLDAVGKAQIGAAVVALLGLLAILWQVINTRKETRSDRALTFQEGYSNREFTELASRTLAYLEVKDPAECVAKIRAWESRRHAESRCLPRTGSSPHGPKPAVNDVMQLFAFFEHFALAFNRNDLAREVVFRGFLIPPIQVFKASWWYVCWVREGRLLGETDRWEQFQRMVNSLRGKPKGLREVRTKRELVQWWREVKSRRGKPAELTEVRPVEESVRVLCLPCKDFRTRAAWESSERLSTALSHYSFGHDVRSLTDLRKRLETTNPTITLNAAFERSLWQILLIPADIDTDPDDAWCAQREEGKAFANWLSSLDQDEDINWVIDEIEERARPFEPKADSA